tara:strand:+ start:4967 stop:5158 length:192 start_codon:yes stop_codon:yes gene_type:complete
MPSNHISNKPYHDWLAERGRKDKVVKATVTFAVGQDYDEMVSLLAAAEKHGCFKGALKIEEVK